MKKLFFLLLFTFIFQFTFSQITDSVVRILDYFTVDQARKRKFQSRDSIVTNTKTDNRFFCVTKGEYRINHKKVSKENYLTELQKQTDERYLPFKRIEYYKSGQIRLVGNFFNGDGIYDSCRYYSENGKLIYFSKVELDTGIIINEGIKRPKYYYKKQLNLSYDKNGTLSLLQKYDQNDHVVESYNNSGILTSRTIYGKKQITTQHYDVKGKFTHVTVKNKKY